MLPKSVRFACFYLIALLICLLCVRLGFWQLHRADEKRHMLAQYQRMTHDTPLALTQKSTPLNYQPVQVTGHYVSPVFFLDNQHYQHQFGYDIIVPFQTEDGAWLLVNQGWLAGDISRRKLPAIKLTKVSVTLTGYAYYPKPAQWQLGPQIEAKGQNRYLLEQVEVDEVAKLLSLPLSAYTLRLAPNVQTGYKRAWKVVSLSPERHLGYAIQWFAMACGLLIMIGYFYRKRESNEA